jgi:hypothetical protein
MTSKTVIAACVAAALGAAAPAAAGAEPVPVIEIDADERIGGRGKVPARMRMAGYDGAIGIEVRGRWSRRYPKKSFALETREPDGSNANVALLGMPADDDWILYAGYNDRTLLRNVLAYDTARWMGRYAARTSFAELRLNGRDHGLYVLMEKPKLHAARVGGEFLLELTSRRQAPRKDPSFLTPLTRRPIVWDDPERTDLSGAEAARIRGAVARTERALYHGRPGAWRRYLHGPSAVDFMLINELFKNEDGLHASTFLSGTPGGRLRFGPVWDFDISMGNSRHGPSRVLPGWMLANRPWAERLYRDRAFARAMLRRWRGLRQAGLQPRLLGVVAAESARIADARARDLARWPTGGERLGGDSAAHVRALERWLVRRIAWLDANLPRLAR